MRELIFGFVLGAGAGTGITYLVMRRMYTRKMQEQAEQIDQDAYNRARAYFEKKDMELAEAEAEKAMAMYRGGDTEVEPEEDIDPSEVGGPTEYDEDDPEDMINKEQNDIIEETEAREKVQAALEASRPKCKILKPEHFGEIEGYECETLSFYVKDHMLVHENGELVEDETFLLDDALDRYGWADDDDNEEPLYVRNYGLQRDYDVQKIMDEWHGNE